MLVSFTASAKSPTSGDVNGDGEISIKDIAMIVNYILGITDTDFVMANADINNDGEIDIKDINDIVLVILNNVRPSCPDENHPHMIDLGLPSGTLWACCNVGANNPEDYGEYFAWGEVTPQSSNRYYWDSYKWCNGDYNKMTKYCTRSNYGNDGFVDNKTVLDAEDDAAYVNWGGDWRMPTIAEFDELLANTTSEWTTQNGVNGRKFTSKTNGKSIFLPAAGYRWIGELLYAGSNGNYWSSTLIESRPYDARHLYFDGGGVYTGDFYRYHGRSVRPVHQN